MLRVWWVAMGLVGACVAVSVAACSESDEAPETESAKTRAVVLP